MATEISISRRTTAKPVATPAISMAPHTISAPPTNGGDDGPRSGSDRRSSAHRSKPQRDVLIGLAGACEFWHDANRVAFASFAVNDHYEHWAVRSREFKIRLSGQFYAKAGRGKSRRAHDRELAALGGVLTSWLGRRAYRG